MQNPTYRRRDVQAEIIIHQVLFCIMEEAICSVLVSVLLCKNTINSSTSVEESQYFDKSDNESEMPSGCNYCDICANFCTCSTCC